MNPPNPAFDKSSALLDRPAAGATRGPRSKAPVFVLGCGRSVTKMLYHTLLAAGGFAVYNAESNTFNLIGLRFGNLAKRENRRALLDHWLRSKLFYRSGLTREEIEPRIMEECHNAGDFLRILMETIGRKQGVERWAESTPLHLLYLPTIKKLFPDALIVHIIRDGRDVTVSLNRIGWIKPLPWDKKRALLAPALFWRWIVTKGRKHGRRMGGDYMEVHYEDVVLKPHETLARLGAFNDQDLDYDRIQQNAQESLRNPNSSFRGDGKEVESNPIERWKTVLSPAEIAQLESVIGGLLQETGYDLATPKDHLAPSLPVRFMSFLYPIYFDAKLWLKTYTPLARMGEINRMGISDPPTTSTVSK
ncbi:MAG: sulfotransferase [Terriglobales bacterium]